MLMKMIGCRKGKNEQWCLIPLFNAPVVLMRLGRVEDGCVPVERGKKGRKGRRIVGIEDERNAISSHMLTENGRKK